MWERFSNYKSNKDISIDTKEKYEAYVNTSFMAAVEPIVIYSAKGATCLIEGSPKTSPLKVKVFILKISFS